MIYRGLALLVVACPCALVIATPVSIVSAMSNAARRGVLVKGGVYLEELAGVRAVAFDKTGTLTQGEPAVTDVVALGPWSAEAVLAAAVSLEAWSEHPLAQAVVRAGEARGLARLAADEFEALPGRGVRGRLPGMPAADPENAAPGETGATGADGRALRLYAGNVRLFEELGLTDPDAAAHVERFHGEGKTTVLVGTEQRVLGVIALGRRTPAGGGGGRGRTKASRNRAHDDSDGGQPAGRPDRGRSGRRR